MITNSKSNNSVKSNELSKNLRSTIKGTSIIFLGAIIGTVLGLLSTIIIARYYSVEEFGLYSIGLVIISIFMGILHIGIFEGSPRCISYYRGKSDHKTIQRIIYSSFQIILISSILFSILLYAASDFIGDQIFNIDGLSETLKIMSFCLPFWAIIRLIINIYRGYESVKENVIFTDITLRAFRVGLFSIALIFSLSFNSILFFFVLSMVFTAILAIIYFYRYAPINLSKGGSITTTKALISFSWPLIFTGLGWFFITGADKIMLGIITSSYEVGLYNVATTLGTYVTIFLSASLFIYQPISTRLIAEKNIQELKRHYQIITKWIFTITFPLIIILIIIPDFVITLLYGEKYIQAMYALQLISIAYFVHTLLGPNGATIVSFGKTKVIMHISIIGGALNIGLNIILIPIFGIEGAALSTMVTLIIINILQGFYLYSISSIHPIRGKFLNPIIIIIIIIIFYYVIIEYLELIDFSLIVRFLMCVALIILYFFLIIILKCFDIEDIQLVRMIEKKTGKRIPLIRIIIKYLGRGIEK